MMLKLVQSTLHVAFGRRDYIYALEDIKDN
jgi:hypothetical protein